MSLPEQYKNLNLEQKKTIVYNLISQFWNEKVQELVKSFNEEQVEFLFTYFFTDSKEDRERMWNDMLEQRKSLFIELKQWADKLKDINLKLSELLSKREDIASFGKDRR